VGYSCQLSGLSDAATYTVSVVSQGAVTSAMSVATSVTVIGDATPPEDIEGLAAVAIP
jgi:BRCT domain type II-containing protein